MKSLALEIKTVVKSKQPVPDKAIFWATQTGYGNLSNGDRNSFPEMRAIVERYSADKPNPLATFGEGRSQA